jgi:hypothetical protein
MRQHAPETQTLYAQLLEATAAHQVDLLGGFATGTPIERVVRRRSYLYWQLRDLAGTLKQVYLGPATDPRAVAMRDGLVAYKAQRRPVLADLKRLTAAYVASGGARHIGSHFKIVDALARAGHFRAGAVLVGSHAFVSIGAALGVSFDAASAATADVDFCRDALVSVACDESLSFDVPGTLKAVDPSFFLVPELDLKAPSTSLRSRKQGVAVDFLTTARSPKDTRPRAIAPFSLAAQPLRYMDYLIRDDVQRGLFIGASTVLVNTPHPGRFALHKLAVAQRRAGGANAIKAKKDLRQAAALIEALAAEQPGALEHALDAAKAHPDKGLVKDMLASKRLLAAAAARALGR